MPHLLCRNGLYYFNFRLSAALNNKRPELRLSLHTRERHEAQYLASTLSYRLRTVLSNGCQQSTHELTEVLTRWLVELQPAIPRRRSSNPSHPEVMESAALTLSQCFKRYLEEAQRAKLWSVKSTDDVTNAVKNCIEILGDLPINKVDISAARRYKETLQKMPKHRDKHPALKGKTLPQILAMNLGFPTISPVTVNNHIRKMKALLNWCRYAGLIEQNPLEQMRVIVPKRPKELRLSFAEDDISALFSSPLYQQRDYELAWRFWIPIIGLCTGARIEEISQLYVDDITIINSHYVLRISDDRPDQHLKNAASKRWVPLSNTLLRLGFLEYVEAIKTANHERVFPELVRRREQYGHAVSKWFSQYKRRLGITDGRKTFHSFRHRAVDVLRECSMPDSIIQCLLGHSTGTVTFDIYGSRTPLVQLQQAVEMLSAQLEELTPCLSS